MGAFIDLKGKRFGKLLVVGAGERKLRGKQYKLTWICKCDCGNVCNIVGDELRNGHTKSCGCIHNEMIKNLNKKHGYSHKEPLYCVWKSMKGRCSRKEDKNYHNYGGRGVTVCDEWKNDYSKFRDWAYKNGYKREKLANGINKLTIDRIDNDKGYSPENCRWVSNSIQAKNKQNSIPQSKRIRICPICGEKFEIRSLTNPVKTCSKKCGIINRSLLYKKQTEDTYKKKCPICHNIFEDRSGHFNTRVYCSKKCKDISLSPIWNYNGESHRVVEWAKITGINAHCLLHRKEMGWDIEKILSTPIKRGGNG